MGKQDPFSPLLLGSLLAGVPPLCPADHCPAPRSDRVLPPVGIRDMGGVRLGRWCRDGEPVSRQGLQSITLKNSFK